MRTRRALAAIAILTVTGCSSAPSTFDLHGTLAITDQASFTWDTSTNPPTCSGTGGLDDITKGTQVIVADQTGTTIAVGYLGGAVANSPAHTCVIAFDVTVPAGRTFYAVTVSHRGAQTFTADQAKAGIALTLG